MNKKALGMEMFNVFIAAAVIASAFFIFYTWYGYAGNTMVAKVDAKTADIQHDYALINLLNTPEQDLTIADLIVTNNPKADAAIAQTMQKVYGPGTKYRFVYDGNIISETAVQPASPTEQYAVLPTPGDAPKNIILRFGV